MSATQRPEWLPPNPDHWWHELDRHGGYLINGPCPEGGHAPYFVRISEDRESGFCGPLGTFHGRVRGLGDFLHACAAAGLTEWLPKVPDAEGWWWRQMPHKRGRPLVPVRVVAFRGSLVWHAGTAKGLVEDDGRWAGACSLARR